MIQNYPYCWDPYNFSNKFGYFCKKPDVNGPIRLSEVKIVLLRSRTCIAVYR